MKAGGARINSLLLTLLAVSIALHAHAADLRRAVALTFDDLPDIASDDHSTAAIAALNRKLLATLRAQHVPAIGFANEGKLVDDTGRVSPSRVAALEAWLEAGFPLGNHTKSHVDLDEVSVDDYTEDVVRGEELTRRLIMRRNGAPPLRWFRHPYLNAGSTIDKRDAVRAFLADRGYRIAPVTVDASEWIFADAYDRALAGHHILDRHRLVAAYLEYMRARFAFAEERSRALFGREIPQVVLLHCDRLNADHVGSLIAMLRGRGYEFITLDEATRDAAYASPDEWLGGGVGWLERWAVTRGMPQSDFEHDPKVPEWVMRYAGAREE